MSAQFTETPDEAGEIAAHWLDSFAAALQAQDAAAVAATFMSDGHWRDVLSFTWDVVTHSGRAAIEAALAPVLARTAAADVQVPDGRTPPRRVKRAGTECIEAIFGFETAFGHANAVVRLVEADGAWRAWSLLTTLEELHGWPDGKPRELSDAERYSRDFGGDNWLDQRLKAQAYEDRDPAVLVVGGG
jgi:putative flavoprotein involved in K+ transport